MRTQSTRKKIKHYAEEKRQQLQKISTDNVLFTATSKQIRKSDSTCISGGDEFTVIFSNLTQTDKVAEIAQNIIVSLGTIFEIKGHKVSIGGSIGISIASQDGENFNDLTKHADMAMYEAKNAGRGTYCFYQVDS